MLGQHALADETGDLRLEALRLGGVVLQVVGGPAERGDRMSIGAAGMNPDRQVVAFGGRIDRPEVATPKRHLAHREHQHLDETRIAGATLDLVDREFDILQRHHDGRAQTRVAIEPFPRDPIVHGARKGTRHVLVQDKLYAVEAVADRQARAPAVEHLGLQLADAGRYPLPTLPRLRGRVGRGRTKIRPRRDRRVGRIADALERIDATAFDRIAPELVQIGHQRPHARHARVDVAIDRF